MIINIVSLYKARDIATYIIIQDLNKVKDALNPRGSQILFKDMADTNHQNSEQNKDMLSFQILRSSSNGGARLGKLAINGRKTLDTPHYIGHTSRGVISHLSHDTFRNKTRIDGVYVALEDCEISPQSYGRKRDG